MPEETFDDDRPTTEEEWERILKRSDLRSARFGELFETVKDHPDRDEILAREMGWKWLLRAKRDEQDDEADSAVDDPDEPDVELDDPQVEAEWGEYDADEDERALQNIAAYPRACEWCVALTRALEDFGQDGDEPDEDDPLFQAVSNSYVVGTKIAGGHAMGYDEQSLCGNIVCCRISLEAADRCIAALETIVERRVVPAETVRPLLEEGREIRRLVSEHIDELRSRVWWE